MEKYKNCDVIQGSSKLCRPCIYYKKSIKSVSDNDIDNSPKSFNEILNENLELFNDSNIDVYDLFGLDRKKVAYDNSVKGYFFFIFPVAIELRNKFVKLYGTEQSTRKIIESKYPNKDYFQYSEKEWHTPNKYTKCKPCDCYIEWT